MRWARILRGLGHRLTIAPQWEGEPCDLLVALHAWRSAESVLRFRSAHPHCPVVVALTGTDLYRDIHEQPLARQALELADRLVALQPLAARELPRHLRRRMRVIHQSVEKTRVRQSAPRDRFPVCVVGHLRAVKDPLRAAWASRLLPVSSRIEVVQAGSAMEEELGREAAREQRSNPRYRWVGALSRPRARQLIASSRLMVLSSLLEGGANVISEAAVDHVPVLASRIPGSIGLLGAGYPGYFPVGDTQALARLLERAETDPGFYRDLKARCARLAPLFRPARERAAWRALLEELSGMRSARTARRRAGSNGGLAR